MANTDNCKAWIARRKAMGEVIRPDMAIEDSDEYGDPRETEKLALNYYDGENGFPQDDSLAAYWLMKTKDRVFYREKKMYPILLDRIKERDPEAWERGLAMYNDDDEQKRYLRWRAWSEEDVYYDGGITRKSVDDIQHEPHPTPYETDTEGRWEGRTLDEDVKLACDTFAAVDHDNAKPEDYAPALKYMERAARGGAPKAQYLMGLYCTQAAVVGYPPDPTRARYWLNKADPNYSLERG